MTDTTLKASRREGSGKGVARKLRQAGQTPAVLYGGEGDAVHLSLDTHDAEYLFRSISVENTIVDLEVEGEKAPVQTLVREIQTHPWKASLLHVDFLRIQKGVAVEVDIPVHLTGTPVGVRLGGGSLEQVIHELPIRCIPSKIPEVIEVDVTELDIGDNLHIYDIDFDDDIELTIEQDRTICSVSAPRAIIEEEVSEGLLDEMDVEVVGEAPDADAGGSSDESEG